MNSIKNYIPKIFFSPYPSVKKGVEQLRQAATVGILVALILFFVGPFGLNTLQPDALKAAICVTFGGITIATVLATHYIAILSFPSFFKSENWNVGKNIGMTLIHFFMVGSANFIFVWSKGWSEMKLDLFLLMQLSTLAVGALPVGILTILKHNRLLRNSLRDAQKLDDLRSKHKREKQTDTIVLSGSNRDEELHTSLDELLFVRAEGNYVEIYTSLNSNRAHLLRSTLSSIEDTLQFYPQLIRSHRSYIVNIEKVEGIQGNAQGLRLVLGPDDLKIPVSRTYLQTVQSYLKNSDLSS